MFAWDDSAIVIPTQDLGCINQIIIGNGYNYMHAAHRSMWHIYMIKHNEFYVFHDPINNNDIP